MSYDPYCFKNRSNSWYMKAGLEPSCRPTPIFIRPAPRCTIRALCDTLLARFTISPRRFHVDHCPGLSRHLVFDSDFRTTHGWPFAVLVKWPLAMRKWHLYLITELGYLKYPWSTIHNASKTGKQTKKIQMLFHSRRIWRHLYTEK